LETLPLHARPTWHAPPEAQQGCPLAPQGVHMPETAVPRPLQVRPEVQLPLVPRPQQGWFIPPQVPQLFPLPPTTQSSGAWQVAPVPLQQG
jgi:hypothetical protein